MQFDYSDTIYVDLEQSLLFHAHNRLLQIFHKKDDWQSQFYPTFLHRNFFPYKKNHFLFILPQPIKYIPSEQEITQNVFLSLNKRWIIAPVIPKEDLCKDGNKLDFPFDF